MTARDLIPRGNYIAVKLDVVRSRRIAERSDFQERLLAVVEDVNTRYTGAVAARFVVTHGDEVQGLLHAESAGGAALIDVVEEFSDALSPQILRTGVGLGTLSTRLQPTAIGMDGPAWHRAKEAIDRAKRERVFIAFSGFDGTGPASVTDATLAALANLLIWQRRRWTPLQRSIISALRQGATQKRAAHSLGISEPAVSKSLHAAGWKHYSDGRAALKTLLASVYGGST